MVDEEKDIRIIEIDAIFSYGMVNDETYKTSPVTGST